MTAKELRAELADNLLKVKNKEISHEIANAVNSAARDLLKTYALEQKTRAMQEAPGPALAAFFELDLSEADA